MKARRTYRLLAAATGVALTTALLVSGCSSSSNKAATDTSSAGASSAGQPAASSGAGALSSAEGSAMSRAQSSVPSSAASAMSSGASGASSAASGAPPAAGSTAPGKLTGTLTIYAAASLTKTFNQLAAEFAKQNPGVSVKPVTYNGSSTLVTQIKGGAPADIFASADDANMTKLTSAGLIEGMPAEFARNELEIAVAPGNPLHIAGLADLAKPGVKVVLCAAGVPCGTAAQTALKAADVTVKPVSQEQAVTGVVTAISTGQADAGLVYKTDVRANSSKIVGVNFPQASAAINSYPIGVVKGSKNDAVAKAFVALVTGPTGQRILGAAGFMKP